MYAGLFVPVSLQYQGPVTSGVRLKVVKMLKLLVPQHTRRPTSEQYTLVCTKMVEKYSWLNVYIQKLLQIYCTTDVPTLCISACTS